MRRYETIFILRPSLNEEEINTVIENSSAIISNTNGQVLELDRWGMRKLAYPIKKETQGFYVFCDYTGTPEAVTEMERKFRIDDSVLRYMTVKTAESISEDEIAEVANSIAAKEAAALEVTEETADEKKPAEDSSAEKTPVTESPEKGEVDIDPVTAAKSE